MSELEVVIEGDLIGRVRMNKAGRLSFDYESGWRDSRNGYSLSVSMRLADITYSHSAVWPYLWNLLPENPNILQRWGQQFHVSSSSPFKLLKFVGADVPHPRSIGSAWMNSRNGLRNCDPMLPLCAALVTAAK